MKHLSLVVLSTALVAVGCAKRMSIGDRNSGSGLSDVNMTFTGMSAELKEKLTQYSLEIAPQGECATNGAKAIPASEKPLQIADNKVSLQETLTRGCDYLIKLKFKAKFTDETGAETEDWVYANFKTAPEDKIESEGDAIKTDKPTVAPEINVYLTAIGEKYNFGIYGGYHKSDGETNMDATVNFGEGVDVLGSYVSACVLKAGTPNVWIKREITLAYSGIKLLEEAYSAAGCAADALISTEEGEAGFKVGTAVPAGYAIDLQITKHSFEIANSAAAATAANSQSLCGKTDWAAGQRVDTLVDATISDQSCKSERLGPMAAFDIFSRKDDKIHFGLKDASRPGNAADKRPIALDESDLASGTKKS